MTNRPELSCVLSARDGLPASDVHHAIVALSAERVERMIARIEESEARRERKDGFLEMSYWDWGAIDFRKEPDGFWDMEEPDHEHHASFLVLDEVRDASAGRLILADALAAGESVAVDSEVMAVYESGIAWRAQYKYGDHGALHTNGLTLADLLVARIYYAAQAEMGARLADLAHHAPERALELIEKGIEVLGQPTIHVHEQLTSASLTPMLEHGDARIRQRAILLLGQLKEERPAGRTR